MMDREGVEGPADLAVVGGAAEVQDAIAALAGVGVTDFVAAEFGSTPDERAETRPRSRPPVSSGGLAVSASASNGAIGRFLSTPYATASTRERPMPTRAPGADRPGAGRSGWATAMTATASRRATRRAGRRSTRARWSVSSEQVMQAAGHAAAWAPPAGEPVEGAGGQDAGLGRIDSPHVERTGDGGHPGAHGRHPAWGHLHTGQHAADATRRLGPRRANHAASP